jgi:hypothetical protein
MTAERHVRIAQLIATLVLALAIHQINAQVQPSTNLRPGSSSFQTGESLITSNSQFGITWTFADALEFGQYVTGDYWVIGPAEIFSMDPPITLSEGRKSNGSMINRIMNVSARGFDGSIPYASFDATLNATMRFCDKTCPRWAKGTDGTF